MTVIYDIPTAADLSDAIKIARTWLSELSQSDFSRFSINLPEIEILALLQHLGHTPSSYWSDRINQFELGGVGVARRVTREYDESHKNFLHRLYEEINRLPGDTFMIGGHSFNTFAKPTNGRAATWNGIERAAFVLPLIEFRRDKSDYTMTLNLSRNTDRAKIEQIIDQIDNMADISAVSSKTNLNHSGRTDLPNYKGWSERIDKTLSLIESGEIDKLVLARESSLQFDQKISPLDLMAQLKERSSGCFHFCFKFTGDKAFIGASPERLFSLDSDGLQSEAVAGTRARGKSATEDAKLEAALTSSEKDIREQRFVIDSVKHGMTQLCDQLQNGGKTQVRKLARVQHLVSTFEGRLKKGTKAIDVLAMLHPTPAVGGHPTEKAIGAIDKIEPFDRGWYAGPVGWIGRDKAEFAVAIRSAMIDKDRLCLYSGAGIVAGSKASAEWDEIESKISNFLNLFESK